MAKWKFSKEWEERIRAIVNNEISMSETWIRHIIRDEAQKIEARRGNLKT